MNDTDSNGMGIWTVAAVFGIVAALVAWFVYEFSGFGSIIVGLIVAALVWCLLWLGWRKPDNSATGSASSDVGSAASAAKSTATTAAAATGSAAAASAGAATSAVTSSTKADTAKSAAAKPAAKKPAATAAKKTTASKSTAAKKTTAAKKPAAAKTTTAKKSTATKKPAASAPKRKPVAADGKPEMLNKARAGGADDLKLIKGVGPKLEKMLNTMGVYHFDQVSSWRAKEVKWVDENLEGFKGRVSRDEWVKQAKILAKGGETEFSKKNK